MSFLQFFYVEKGLSLNFNKRTIEPKRLARTSRSGIVKDRRVKVVFSDITVANKYNILSPLIMDKNP